MKMETSWLDLTILGVLSTFLVYSVYIFLILSFLKYVFLRVAYINKYFDDGITNNINAVLNHIVTYKNGIIIVLCVVLTLYILLFILKFYKPKFSWDVRIRNSIIIFIYFFGLLSLLMQIFISI